MVVNAAAHGTVAEGTRLGLRKSDQFLQAGYRNGCTDRPYGRTAGTRGPSHGFGTDDLAGARAVLDDDGLAPHVAQPLSDGARQDIRNTAGRRWHNDLHRLRWVTLSWDAKRG